MQQIPHPIPCHADLLKQVPEIQNGAVLRSRKLDRKTGPVSITMSTKRSSFWSKMWSSFGGRASGSNVVGGNGSDLPRNFTAGAHGLGLDGAAVHTPSSLETPHPSLRRRVHFIRHVLVQSAVAHELASSRVNLSRGRSAPAYSILSTDPAMQ